VKRGMGRGKREEGRGKREDDRARLMRSWPTATDHRMQN
jgi:hypothetical protein